MKGFFEWFKSSTKMKRWMFLILIGMALVCYSVSEIIVLKEISFFEVGKIILMFVVGFTFSVIGLISIQKRTLEMLIETTDSRMENKKNINIKSLIFNKKVYNEGPNIVVIGGGPGLNTVLQGLKFYTNNLTGIVTVSNYGNIPTDSRKALKLLPTEDIQEGIVSIANNQEEMEKLLNFKFTEGQLAGLSFGDIYLLAMKDVIGDFSKSIEKSSEILNVTGKILPVTLDEVEICAELDDGTVIEKKDKIPEIVYDKVTKINRIYINPTNCKAAPGVIEAINNADAIILGPGSLYTNVIPNLLVNGVSKAIKDSKALKIYVNNIMTEPGQTDNYTVSDHINAIVEHAGEGIINFCIYDTGEVVPEFIKKYNMRGADLVEQDPQKLKAKGINILKRNLSIISDDHIRHNPNAVAGAIIEIICDDLKFRDKQNDPQYLMMNAKLKYEKKAKRIPKQSKNMNDKKDKKGKRGNSKFASKYSERIESIRKTDDKIKEKRRLQKEQEEKEKAEFLKETKKNKSKK